MQRKHAHKISCTNIKSSNYNCRLYNVIRNNGGWTALMCACRNQHYDIINYLVTQGGVDINDPDLVRTLRLR